MLQPLDIFNKKSKLALYWLRQAAGKGHKDAMKALQKMPTLGVKVNTTSTSQSTGMGGAGERGSEGGKDDNDNRTVVIEGETARFKSSVRIANSMRRGQTELKG